MHGGWFHAKQTVRNTCSVMRLHVDPETGDNKSPSRQECVSA